MLRPSDQRQIPHRPWWWSVAAIALAGVIYIARQSGWIAGNGSTTSKPSPSGTETRHESNTELSSLIRDHRSGVVVESAGVIAKLLPDDVEGDRHQRFLVRLSTGEQILIAHNIDLASRAPVHEGDPIRFRGEFEWNDRGGVVHWTHHATSGRHPPGWIEVARKRYD